MAEEHTNKIAEGSVETQDRGMFDFLGKKKEDENIQPQPELIASDVDKVKIEEGHKEDEKKHGTLLEKLHRSGSSSSSSSDEEVDENGEKKKKKKEKKKEGDCAVTETGEKKGVMEKIKEKLPGQHTKDEAVTTAPAPPSVSSESVVVEHREEESKEKKGIMEKIKEKLPGYHSKTEDESNAAANH